MKEKLVLALFALLVIMPLAAALCGDGTCDNDETSDSCEEDCVVRLTPQGTQQDRAKISGDYVVWQDGRNNAETGSDIYAYKISTGEEIRVTSEKPLNCSFASCPGGEMADSDYQRNPDIDGTKVVYNDYSHMCKGTTYWSPCADIYLYDFSTGEHTLVSSHTTGQGYPRIQGNKVTWYDSSTSGPPLVYYRDLRHNREYYVGEGQYPAVYNEVIVYQDFKPSTESQIAVYYSDVGSTQYIETSSGSTFPDIDNYKLVYQDFVNNGWEVFVYDLMTGQKQQLTTSGNNYHRNVAIHGDKVTYTDFSLNAMGDIAVYDLSTGESSIIDPTATYNNYAAIYGTKVVSSDSRYDVYGDVFMYYIGGGGSDPYCGDGNCNDDEACFNCPADCGSCPPFCGDGNCEGDETCISCPADCGNCFLDCGDGNCGVNETCTNCPTDCGVCIPGCGDGNCAGNETCIICPADCGLCPPVCGDGSCDGDESCRSCPADCGTCLCTETDNGKDYYLKGDTTRRNETNTDSCTYYDEYIEECGGVQCNLYEYYCRPDNLVGLEEYRCPEGCIDGECSSTPRFCGDGRCNWDETHASCPVDCTFRCRDSDGGKNIYVKGIAEQEHQRLTDYCNSPLWNYAYSCNDPECMVAEAYCEWDYGLGTTAYKVLPCPNGCEDGACLNEASCGDGNCNVYESCINCPADCGECGNEDPVYAYVVGTKGLDILDVTDVSSPQLIGEYTRENSVFTIRDIDVVGDKAYLAGDGDFIVLDVSDKTNPSIIGSLDLPGKAYGIDVDGSYAYVANQELGLGIIDVSDLNSIEVVGIYSDCNYNNDVKVVDNYAFLVCNEPGSEFKSIDISDKTNPQFVAKGWSFGNTPQNVDIQGDFAYITLLSGDLAKFNITDIDGLPGGAENYYPGMGTYGPPYGTFRDFVASGGYGYLADNDGLDIMDVSGRLDVKVGNTTYSNLSSTGHVDTPGFSHGVDIHGDYVYVADEHGGLRIVDISNPKDPALVGYYPIQYALEVFVVSDEEPAPTEPPTQECGDGSCDASESISTCFIDCKTGDSGKNCEEIAPLSDVGIDTLRQGFTFVDEDLVRQLSANELDETIDEFREPIGLAEGDFDIGMAPDVSTENISGYIVQLEEEPAIVIENEMQADIDESELKTKLLEIEIESTNTKGFAFITGGIKKFMLNNERSTEQVKAIELKRTKNNKVKEQFEKLSKKRNEFKNELRKKLGKKTEEKIVQEHKIAFNGVVMDVSAAEAAEIEKLPGVKAVFPNSVATIDLTSSVGYINADSVWNLEDDNGDKITGKGVTIAVIDTGIDYTHADLGGCIGELPGASGGGDGGSNVTGGVSAITGAVVASKSSPITGNAAAVTGFATASTCGDGSCDGNELCSTCPSDCGLCFPNCGDGNCDVNETCTYCPADCGFCTPVCGDGSCGIGEYCSTCPADCGTCDQFCGDRICDGNETCSSCSIDCGPCDYCTETDNGKDYYLKGNTTGPRGVNGSNIDRCTYYDEYIEECGGVQCWLYEYYCKLPNFVDVEKYRCPEGCIDGACSSTPRFCGDGRCNWDETNANCPADCTFRCKDSDGGKNIYVKGIAEQEHQRLRDYCNSPLWNYTYSCSDTECMVAEAYCDWEYGIGSTAYKVLPCPNGCEDGACLSEVSCGDGLCNGDETCTNCPADCGVCAPVCGDGTCNGLEGENCFTCEQDCGVCAPVCGDGNCDANETCNSCPADCGECRPGCGDGYCGATENCDNCKQDCGVCPLVCGDGICNDHETHDSCPSDCKAVHITISNNSRADVKISGNYIVWEDHRDYETSRSDIYVYDISTGSEIRIPAEPPLNCSPKVEPHLSCSDVPLIGTKGQIDPDVDNGRVVYADRAHYFAGDAGYSDCNDIYMYDIATGEFTHVSSHPKSQREPSIHGDIVTWHDYIYGEFTQVYYKNLVTGEEVFVGNGSYPDVHGNYIVYLPTNVDPYWLMLYNIDTGELTGVDPWSFGFFADDFPSIYGDKIAYETVRVYDISTGQRLGTISSGGIPAIYEDLIVYRDDGRENDAYKLLLYDLSTMEEKIIHTAEYFVTSLDVDDGKVAFLADKNGKEFLFLYYITGDETPTSCGDGVCGFGEMATCHPDCLDQPTTPVKGMEVNSMSTDAELVDYGVSRAIEALLGASAGNYGSMRGSLNAHNEFTNWSGLSIPFGPLAVVVYQNAPEQIIDITTTTASVSAYVPANTNSGVAYYVAGDGSTYFARSDHGAGTPNLNAEDALVPEHLARAYSSSSCGDGTCDEDETYETCPQDCEEVDNMCKIIGGYDFYNNDADPMDDHGHGTHVAATAAGDGVLKGVAPDAKILAYKVCSSAGSCPNSDIIAAIERSLDPNQDGNFDDRADIISMSLGGSGTPDSPAALAIDNAFDNGIFSSISAGNNGPGSQTIGCPSCARKAMSVAAWCKPEHVGYDYRCDIPIASFSSRGPVVWSGGTLDKPEISAPGVRICAAQWQNAWASSECIDNEHTSISGTSMAAPHVAGVAALIKQAHPDWEPQQIKDAIMNTAVDLGLDMHTQGAGLVDALAAVQLTDTFPIAAIYIPIELSGFVDVTGTASGTNFTGYTLEYGKGNNPTTWYELAQSDEPVINGALGSWDTGSLDDDEYTLRLTVTNNIGEVNQKKRNVVVNNVYINYPYNEARFSNSFIISIEGTVLGNNFDNYDIEWKSISGVWSTAGVTLINNGIEQKENEIIATWDTNLTTEDGTHYLRLTSNYDDGRTITEQVSVTIDSQLISGWPKQLETVCGEGWCPTVVYNPTLADIDGDGTMEVLTGTAHYPPSGGTTSYRHVFRHDGSPMPGWPIIKSDHLNNGFVVSDLDEDGVMELLINDYSSMEIYTPTGQLRGSIYVPGNNCITVADVDKSFAGKEIVYATTKSIVVTHYDGSIYMTIPLEDVAYASACPAIGDVNKDGLIDIISTGFSTIYAFDENGNSLPGWPKNIGEYISSKVPSLGDLDGDGDLEIALGGNNGTVFVYHHDGTNVDGFPFGLYNGRYFTTPVISDLNGDGVNELVTRNYRHIYVFNKDGTIMSGWPQQMGNPGGSDSLTQMTVADMDGDLDLEIMVGRFAWHHTGQSVSGFPKDIPEVFFGMKGAPAVGDLDNDGDVELVLGPTSFDRYIFVFDLDGNPDLVASRMTMRDSEHTNNYESGVLPGLTPFDNYYYYTLSDNDCTVNLTLNSYSGNQTLSVRYEPDVCDDSWDESVTASAGETKTLTRAGLNKGSYALMIEGIGSYALSKDSFCLEDGTDPSITVDDIASYVSGDTLFSADVYDSNGLSECEVCISDDGTCDIEWSSVNVEESFSSGAKQGVCSFLWNTSTYQSGLYFVNFRVIDIGDNIGTGEIQSTFLDTTPPVISYVMASTPVDANEQIDVSANVSDNLEVALVSASFLGQVKTMIADNNTGVYNTDFTAPSTPGEHTVTVTAYDIAGANSTLEENVAVNEDVDWSDDLRISRGAITSNSAVAENGDTHLVWQDNRDGNYEIYYTKLSSSGQILIYDQRITSNLYNSLSPAITTDSLGNIHIAWQDDRDGNKEIYYEKLSSNGTSLVHNSRITDNVYVSETPGVHTDSEGDIHLFWIDDRGGEKQIYYTKLDNDGGRGIPDQQFTYSNEVVSYDSYAISSLNELFILWQDSGNAINYKKTGGLDDATMAIASGSEPAIAVGSAVNTIWTGLDGKLHYKQLTKSGDAISNEKILTGFSVSENDIAMDASGKQHIVFNGPDGMYYIKLNGTGSYLVSGVKIAENAAKPQIISSAEEHVVWSSTENNDVYYKTTATIEQGVPLITNVVLSDVRETSAIIRWQTNEAASSEIKYGETPALESSYADYNLSLSHEVILKGLNDSTKYLLKVVSEDIMGNTASYPISIFYINFTTEKFRKRPAMPTTFYGRVIYRNGTPAPNIEVTARWNDVNGDLHETKETTLNYADALALGDITLVGYYMFNKGNVNAEQGSTIELSTNKMVGNDSYVIASPGGDAIQATGLLTIDVTPAVITINSPVETSYTTTKLFLNYNVNEDIEWAGFSLNGQDTVTITELQNTNINITAAFGDNTLIVYARDTIGLESEEQVTFTVEDITPPLVFVNRHTLSRDILELSANVSDDITPLSQSCEVCITQGSCTWLSASNDFTGGSMSGKCTYQWNTENYEDGDYSISFRVTDGAGNTGTGTPVIVSTDNTAPTPVNFNAVAVPGEAKVQLSWSQSAAGDFESYKIFRSSSPEELIATITNSAVTSYTDADLTSGATYNYKVTVIDELGNEDTNVQPKQVTIDDIIAPTVTITSPTARTYSEATITLSFNVDEATNWCGYSLNQAANVSASSGQTFTAAEGTNEIVVYCTDNGGNTGSDEVDFSVDTMPPPALVTTVQTVSGENALDISWSASSASDFAHYRIYKSASPFSSVSDATLIRIESNLGTTSYRNLGLVSEETYYYAVTAQDQFGNENKVVTSVAGTVADTVNPEVMIFSPMDTVYNTATVPLMFDTDEPVSECTFSLNGGVRLPAMFNASLNALEGDNSVTVYCSDLSDNEGSASADFEADTETPTVVNNLGVSTVAGQNALDLSWSASSARDFDYYKIYRSDTPFSDVSSMTPIATTGATSYRNYGLVSKEMYYYAVTAVDKYNNENTAVSSVGETVVDTDNPVVTITSPTETVYDAADVLLSFNVTEEVSGCEYSMNSGPRIAVVSGTTITGLEGDNTIVVYCKDLVDNEGSDSVNFGVDAGTPGAISGLSVQTVAGQGALDISWSASSARDFSQYKIYRSDAPFTDVSSMTEITTTSSVSYRDSGLTSEETYYYAVTAVDKYSNENTGVSSVSGVVDDTDAPDPITGLSVTPITGQNSLDLSWDMSDAGDFARYNIYRSNNYFANVGSASLVETITNKQTKTYTDSGLVSEATYYYVVTAVDNGGNENKNVAAVQGIVADTVEPIITIHTPISTMYPDPTVLLTFSVSEATAGCEYSLNGEENISITGTSAQMQCPESHSKVTVYCTDEAGNTGDTFRRFSVDTTPPGPITMTNVDPVPGRDHLWIAWERSSESVCSHNLYRSDSMFSDISQATYVATVGSSITDTGLESEKTYYYAVVATDCAGNANTSVVPLAGTVADIISPGKITGLNVETVPGETELELSWQQSDALDFETYNIYKLSRPFTGTYNAILISQISDVTDTTFTDTGLVSEATYHYAVTAVDNSSNEDESVVSVSGRVADVIPPVVTLTSPQSMTYDTRTLTLSFYVSEATSWCGYSLNGGANVTASNGQSFIADEGANNFVLYCNDGAGNTGTDSVSFNTDTTPPDPINFVVEKVPGETSVEISWQQSSASDFKSYKIYRLNSQFSDVSAATLIKTETNKGVMLFTNTGLASEATYHYAVTVDDLLGNEDKAIVSKSATIDDTIPPTISIISPQDTTYSQVEIAFEYFVSEPVNLCIYSLNGAANVTISSNTTIVGIEGDNELRIRCTDFADNIGIKNVDFRVNTQAPAPIQGLSVLPVPGERKLSVTWQASAATDLSHYNIYRHTTSFNDTTGKTLIATSQSTSYIDSDVLDGYTYYYAITAVDSFGNQENSVVSKGAIVPDTTPPEKITGLNVVTVPGQTRLDLLWDEETDAANYNIFRSDSDFSFTGSMTAIASTAGTTYSDVGLESGETYYYAVSGIDESGNEDKNVNAVAGTVADLTQPGVNVLAVGSPSSGTVTISAAVYDEHGGLAETCEVCVYQGSCTEWITADSNFEEGAKNGSCSYRWDTTESAEGIYDYNFRVKDLDDNIETGSAKQTEVIHLSSDMVFNMNLMSGWNLVSLPLVPMDKNTESVLSSIGGSYSKVYYYNSAANAWQVYNPYRTVFDQQNDLLEMDIGRGYWIQASSDTLLEIQGAQVPSYNLDLAENWNFIGYPYTTEKPVETALASLGNQFYKLYAYNITADKWDVYRTVPSVYEPNTITTMRPGEGYMIDMIEQRTWSP
ncbi:MAG: S8 family serine peptidase [bacterium]|nr:S8 family serine peptidase [bacterium]